MQRQVAIPVKYDGIVIDNKVIVELKSVHALQPVHAKQVLTYIRLANKRLGLLLNFGEEIMKQGIRRLVNNLPE